MTRLTSWSIRSKLIGLGVASAAVALLLAGVALAVEDQMSFRATKLENVAAVAAIVGHNAAAALAFDDAVSGEKILSGLAAKKSITRASVYRRDGAVFATYSRDDVPVPWTPPAIRPDQAVFDATHLKLFRQVILDGEPIGTIYLESDLAELRERLLVFLAILAAITVAATGVSLLLSLWLQRRISGPILELVAVARRVSTTKDYTVRAAVGSADETGQLIDVFNEMLAAVESRDQELERQRLQLQEELRVRAAVNVELAAARQKADESNAAKSQFLANMSHEIRTPMNGVIGMTELLTGTTLAPEQRDYLDVIRQSADTLLGVIEDILDFSKIEAGMLQVDPITIEAAQLFGETAKALALRAHEKGLELVCHVSPAVPPWIVADPLRLRQVLTNLIGNAIKFTERGEISLDVAVDADATPRADGRLILHVRVKDTGIGIPGDKLAQIFAPFEQADGSTTRKYGGTGLGLAISSRLATLMNGSIWVDSEEGRGSTFHFTTEVTRGIGAPPDAADDTVLAGLRVLVIDDNATNRFVLREMVQRWGMRPTTADGGERGLEAIANAASQRDPFHVVLLDCHMPNLDGFMVAERIRATSGLSDVTILMLTSAQRSADARRCEALGLAAYLVKPVTQKELRATVLRVLSGTSAHVAPASGGRDPMAGRALRILLAEDNLVNQKVAIALLSRLGHDVTVADNGQLAVDAFRRDTFDLILMDVQMPELNGYDATRAIRLIEASSGTHVPIVAMTARAMKGDRERCLEAGMDDYLSKPIERAAVLALLGRTQSQLLPPRESVTAAAFDEAVALELAGGDEQVLQEVKELGLAETPRLLEVIAQALSDGRVDAVLAAAHALNGMSLVFGATDVAAIAARLESLVGAGDVAGAAAAYSTLPAAADRLMAALRAPKHAAAATTDWRTSAGA